MIHVLGLRATAEGRRGFPPTVGHPAQPSRRGATIEPSPHHRPPKGYVSSSPHIPSSLRDERFARHQRVGWPPSAVLPSPSHSKPHDGRGRPSYERTAGVSGVGFEQEPPNLHAALASLAAGRSHRLRHLSSGEFFARSEAHRNPKPARVVGTPKSHDFGYGSINSCRSPYVHGEPLVSRPRSSSDWTKR